MKRLISRRTIFLFISTALFAWLSALRFENIAEIIKGLGIKMTSRSLYRLKQNTTDYFYYVDVIFNFLLFLVLLQIFRAISVYLYRKRKHQDQSYRDNFISGLDNLYGVIITFSVLITGLSLMKVDLATFFTSFSIIAAALAIVSKDYVANITNGFIITFSNQINIGESVRIGKHKGKILDITLTYVLLLNDDDDLIYVPNNIIFASEIVNFSRREIKKTTIEFSLETGQLDAVDKLEQFLSDSLADYMPMIREESLTLKVVEINKDTLSFKFQYVLKEPDRVMEQQIRKHTIRQVVMYVAEKERQAAMQENTTV